MKKFAKIKLANVPALLISFIILLALGPQAMAQYTVAIGPKIGLGGSWISGKDAPSNQDVKVAPVVGGFLTYSSANILGFTIEAQYNQKGARFNNVANNTDYAQRLHYVEIPALVRFFFGSDGAKVRPNLFIGPSFNFLVKATQIAMNSDNSATRANTDSFKNFELGAHAGGGLNIRMTDNQWLDLNLRYMQGLTNINDVKTVPGRDDSIMNSGLLFSVGYGFGI